VEAKIFLTGPSESFKRVSSSRSTFASFDDHFVVGKMMILHSALAHWRY